MKFLKTRRFLYKGLYDSLYSMIVRNMLRKINNYRQIQILPKSLIVFDIDDTLLHFPGMKELGVSVENYHFHHMDVGELL